MIISTLQQQFPSFAINGDGSTISLLSLAIFIVAIIARYMLFIKMGEEGWKSLIPFYNRYVLFEKCWKGSYFIISLAAIIPAVVLAAAAFAVFETRPEIAILLGCIAAVSIMVTLVINLILAYKLSRAFGHGILFTIGFLCMTNIFTMILLFLFPCILFPYIPLIRRLTRSLMTLRVPQTMQLKQMPPVLPV